MWKYGFASVAGTSHARHSLPCQDASRAEVIFDAQGDEVLIAVASDGAGSAGHAQLGSAMACDLFVAEVKTHFTSGGSWERLADGFITDLITNFQRLVTGWAGDGQRIQDFACTLLAAVAGRECVAYFHLGDGAIIESLAGERDQYRCVCWPQQGEYANTTNFLTDADAKEKIFCQLKASAADEVALFTDGIQSLVLDYRTQSAHSPYFASLFGWLRPHPGGYSQQLSDSLGQYLNSEKINARTADDKTLILASRIRPVLRPVGSE